jgi:hypothetical protein
MGLNNNDMRNLLNNDILIGQNMTNQNSYDLRDMGTVSNGLFLNGMNVINNHKNGMNNMNDMNDMNNKRNTYENYTSPLFTNNFENIRDDSNIFKHPEFIKPEKKNNVDINNEEKFQYQAENNELINFNDHKNHIADTMKHLGNLLTSLSYLIKK